MARKDVNNSVWPHFLGRCLHRMGRRADALATLQKMDEQAGNRYVAPSFRAQVYAALGDSEKALVKSPS